MGLMGVTQGPERLPYLNAEEQYIDGHETA